MRGLAQSPNVRVPHPLLDYRRQFGSQNHALKGVTDMDTHWDRLRETHSNEDRVDTGEAPAIELRIRDGRRVVFVDGPTVVSGRR